MSWGGRRLTSMAWPSPGICSRSYWWYAQWHSLSHNICNCLGWLMFTEMCRNRWGGSVEFSKCICDFAWTHFECFDNPSTEKSLYWLNQHFGATVLGDGDSDIRYTHKILPGPCKIAADYGVEMAGTCRWPEEVVCEVNDHAYRNIPGFGYQFLDHWKPLCPQFIYSLISYFCWFPIFKEAAKRGAENDTRYKYIPAWVWCIWHRHGWRSLKIRGNSEQPRKTFSCPEGERRPS